MMFLDRLLHKKVLLLLWIFFIIFVSLYPGEKLSESRFEFFEGIDKLIHGFIYAVFAFLMDINFERKPDLPQRKVEILVILLAGTFGLIMEILQYYLIFLARSFEIWDVLYNILGAIIGYGLLKLLKIKF